MKNEASLRLRDSCGNSLARYSAFVPDERHPTQCVRDGSTRQYPSRSSTWFVVTRSLSLRLPIRSGGQAIGRIASARSNQRLQRSAAGAIELAHRSTSNTGESSMTASTPAVISPRQNSRLPPMRCRRAKGWPRGVSAPSGDTRLAQGTRVNGGAGARLVRIGIHWPALDKDISVKALLLGLASNESAASLRRWRASRRSASRRMAPTRVRAKKGAAHS